MRAIPVVALLALAACGDDGAQQFLDGGLDGAQDAGDDALGDGSQFGAVTVVVSQSATLIQGAAVYFQNADGSLAGKVMTDATGRASLGMAPGGYITVFNPFAATKDGPELYTFMGVEPGDVLQLPDIRNLPTDNLTYTSTPPTADDWQYRVWVSGGTSFDGTASSTGDGVLSIVEPPQATVDGFIVATDGLGMTKYIIQRDLVLDTVAPVLAFGGTWTDLPAAQYTMTNIPAEITNVAAFEHQATARGIVFGSPVINAAPTAGTLVQNRDRVAVGTSVIFEATFDQGATNGERRVTHWQPATDALTFDYSNILLAPFTSVATYSAANKTLSWSEGTGASPDGTYLYVDVESISLSYRWTFVAPHTVGAFVFPTLPSELDQYNLGAGYTPYINNLETYKVPGGYDALRSGILVGRRFGLAELGISVPASGSGVAAFQRYSAVN
jgi:hypothetical protein